MCLGQQPQAPNVVYRGPSDADIAANQASLDQYQAQINEQQAAFQTQLQEQIDAAEAETEKLRSDFAAEAAAESQAAAAQSAYTVTTQETEIPKGAQTTAAVTKKKKPKANLRISTAGTANSAGSGINLGI
jgi:predicted HAD superfamily Cof-like phosphohydrolase|tara:strand:- start:275 stop:667 length:393 start_codon:yes stop_codon:yes gene_type:complete